MLRYHRPWLFAKLGRLRSQPSRALLAQEGPLCPWTAHAHRRSRRQPGSQSGSPRPRQPSARILPTGGGRPHGHGALPGIQALATLKTAAERNNGPHGAGFTWRAADSDAPVQKDVARGAPSLSRLNLLKASHARALIRAWYSWFQPIGHSTVYRVQCTDYAYGASGAVQALERSGTQ
jgi:hypothetical protein